MKASRIRHVVPATIAVAVTLGIAAAAASGAGLRAHVVPPAGGPDLSQMALRLTDVPRGAKIARQRYVKTSDFVAEYDREFKEGTVRLGGKRLLGLESDIGLAASAGKAALFVDAFHAMVSTKKGRSTLAKQAAKGTGLGAKSVTVGPPVNLRIGNQAYAVPIRFATPFGDMHMVIAVHRVDRVVSTFYYLGSFGVTVPASSAKTFARPIAQHMHDGLMPAATIAPSITGTAQVGQTLTVTTGTWTNKPTGYTYQWLRCDATGGACVGIAEATQQTYVVQQDDVGSTLRVVETATNAIGSSSSESQQTAVVISLPPS